MKEWRWLILTALGIGLLVFFGSGGYVYHQNSQLVDEVDEPVEASVQPTETAQTEQGKKADSKKADQKKKDRETNRIGNHIVVTAWCGSTRQRSGAE